MRSSPQLDTATDIGAPPITASRTSLPVLTTLRFFAAASVVAYHWDWHNLAKYPFVQGLTSAGPEAVLFFFVLSGFILTYVYLEPQSHNSLSVSTKEFWKARFARIAPVYYVGLVISLPILLYSVIVAHIASGKDLILCAMTAPLFLQAWCPSIAGLWNPPGWTLSVECFFYLSFPYIWIVAKRLSVAVLFVGSYLFVVSDTVFGPHILHAAGYNDHIFLPILHLPSFLFGISLGVLYLRSAKISPGLMAAAFGVTAVTIVVGFAVRNTLAWWLFSEPVLIALFGILIYSGGQAGRALSLLANPVFSLFGEASYAMYILHRPIVNYWNLATKKLVGNAYSTDLMTCCSFVVCFCFILTISVLSYSTFEKPMRRRLLGHSAHKAI